MTDLSDTLRPYPVEDPAERARRLAHRRARLSLWAGGLMFVASLGVTVGGVGSQREPIDVALAPVTPVTAATVVEQPPSVLAPIVPQVASSPPTLPCVSWHFGDGDSEGLVIGGTPCIDVSVLHDSTPVASTVLASSPAGIGTVTDPVLHTSSTAVPGQIYGSTVVMLEREPVSGIVSVVARSLDTFAPVWTQTCPAPTLVPAVHFSGGDVARDVAANRADIAVYGVTDYVAIGCDGGPVLYEPVTGTRL